MPFNHTPRERGITCEKGKFKMDKEFYNFNEVLLAVLDGANDVAVWVGGNHELGHKEGQEWYSDGWRTHEEWDLMQAIVRGIMAGQFRLYLTKKQEENLNNIMEWLWEDDVEIRFPA